VLNVVDGCIPSDFATGAPAEIEEERRLLYVAMTRARDDLHLVLPQRFFTYGQSAHGDKHLYASRTRFVPDTLLDLFERNAWPLIVPEPAAAPAGDCSGARGVAWPAHQVRSRRYGPHCAGLFPSRNRRCAC
jgi:DNA helicase-2/ATP-dependent DNA helicase PcrA